MKRLMCRASFALILCVAVLGSPGNTCAQFGGPGPAVKKVPNEENLLPVEGTPGKPSERQVEWASVSDSDPVAVQRIEDVLDKPLHAAGLVFSEKPLSAVTEELRNEYKIPILLDTIAIAEVGKDTNVPININLRGVSLRAGLRHLLSEQELTYVIRDEALVITSKQRAEYDLITCVYDTHNLAPKAQPPDGVITQGSQVLDYDALVGAITACIATDTWDENGGGHASIRPISEDLLVVTQTRDVHNQIRNLLSRSHQMQTAVGKNSKAADSAKVEAEAVIDPNEVVTRNYMLTMTPPKDVDAMRAEVRKLIVDSFPDMSWSGRGDDGKTLSLTVMHDRIILQHTRATQTKVEKLLYDSGLVYSTSGGMFGSPAVRGFGRST